MLGGDECVIKNTAKPTVLDDDLKYIFEKFSAIYGGNVSIKAMKSGKINLSVNFNCVEDIYNILGSIKNLL